MTPIRARTALISAALSTGLCWLALDIWTVRGLPAPPLGWTAVAGTVALVIVVLVAGLPVRRWVQGRSDRPADPLRAARVAALARAAVPTGGVLAGWYLAQALILAPDLVGQRRVRFAIALLAALAASVLAGVGLLVQRWCTVPPQDPPAADPDSGSTGGSNGGASRDSRGSGRPQRVALLILALTFSLAGCSLLGGGRSDPSAAATPTSGAGGKLTLAAADYTQMQLMQQLYGHLLRSAGYTVQHQAPLERDQALDKLANGTVDVVPDLAATVTEQLNHAQDADADVVASADLAVTMAALRPLARWRGFDVLAPAAAAEQNGFAMRRDLARKQKITRLSQLAGGAPLRLAATADCASRPFCAPGLNRVYGLTIAEVLPLGFGTDQAKQAVLAGQADLVQVSSIDGTLPQLGLRLLQDDRRLQLADNLVPLVSRRAAQDPQVAAALAPLAAALTTSQLAIMVEQVDGQRRPPRTVALQYLRERGLLPAP